jgi:hypothetical protein
MSLTTELEDLNVLIWKKNEHKLQTKNDEDDNKTVMKSHDEKKSHDDNRDREDADMAWNFVRQNQIHHVVHFLLRFVYLHPTSFHLIWKPFHVLELRLDLREQGCFDHVDNTEDDNNEFEEKCVVARISQLTWSTVLFPNYTSLTMSLKPPRSPYDQKYKMKYDDIRGGGSCSCLCLPNSDFVWTIHNPNGITVQNVVECVYRLKSSKYDVWYEYCDDLWFQRKYPHIEAAVTFGYDNSFEYDDDDI